MGDEAMELFHMINPINHMRTPEDVERYRAEPYAVAADVYAHPMHVGRGGWTWYTGSAGWMYQAAVQALLGLQRRGRHDQHQPVHPDGVAGVSSLDWTIGGTRYRFVVENPEHCSRGIVAREVRWRAGRSGRDSVAWTTAASTKCASSSARGCRMPESRRRRWRVDQDS